MNGLPSSKRGRHRPRFLLSNEQRTRLFAVPITPRWRSTMSSAPMIWCSSEQSGAQSIGLGLPSNYASYGIRASAWDRPSNRRRP
jgi:hypothetical protein